MVNKTLRIWTVRKIVAAMHKQLAFTALSDHMTIKRMRRAGKTAAVLAA
jgi:predicted phosphoribosyltransferase